MNVLFLTRYPELGASSRYRVFQYLPYLEAMGVRCTVQSFMDEGLYRMSLGPGRTLRKGAATARAILRRLAAALDPGRYDLIFLQRELLPVGPPIVERWLARQNVPVIFDIDDALFLHKDSRFSPLASSLRMPEKTIDLFRLADCVVTGNDWLRDRARAVGAHAVTVEVAEDTRRFAPRKPDLLGPVTVGWLGSPTTVKYLDALAPVLQGLACDHPELRFEIMGGGDFAMDGVPWHQEDWSLPGELAALGRFDIGLMPLPREEWALGKSGGKARTYMAAGVVPVCSKIGYNRELIDEGRTGFLCTTLQDWDHAIRRLIARPDLRQRIAGAARAEVAERFDPKAQAGKLKALFDGLVTRGRAVA